MCHWSKVTSQDCRADSSDIGLEVLLLLGILLLALRSTLGEVLGGIQWQITLKEGQEGPAALPASLYKIHPDVGELTNEGLRHSEENGI